MVSTSFRKKPLANKVALVTGAARNLPAVISLTLAEAGATVAVQDIHLDDDLLQISRKIHKQGGKSLAVEADVCKRNKLQNMISRVTRELGTIDILVNGVGPYVGKPFLELNEEDWDLVIDTNLKSVYLLSQLVTPNMKEKGWGRIVNLSAGSADSRSASVYALAKNAVRFLTQCLAYELGPTITVNAISPGQIAESVPDISQIDPTFVSRAIENTPLERLVSREEIAQMVVLLCSSEFDMVTGQTVKMDGGWSIPRL